jgi:integrase
LPLLGLFTGARRSELAALTVEDVDTATYAVPVITITEDKKRGKRVKSRASLRTIALRPELLRLGFLEFVSEAKHARGSNAWLFPQIAPDAVGTIKAWSKWFRRYLEDRGIVSPDKVFHSFRHSFIDALRAGGVYGDLLHALAGHAASKGSARVNEGYGAKQMVRRFSIERIIDAVANAKYPGLDLSQVRRARHRWADATE